MMMEEAAATLGMVMVPKRQCDRKLLRAMIGELKSMLAPGFMERYEDHWLKLGKLDRDGHSPNPKSLKRALDVWAAKTNLRQFLKDYSAKCQNIWRLVICCMFIQKCIEIRISIHIEKKNNDKGEKHVYAYLSTKIIPVCCNVQRIFTEGSVESMMHQHYQKFLSDQIYSKSPSTFLSSYFKDAVVSKIYDVYDISNWDDDEELPFLLEDTIIMISI